MKTITKPPKKAMNWIESPSNPTYGKPIYIAITNRKRTSILAMLLKFLLYSVLKLKTVSTVFIVQPSSFASV